ncbi:oligosaccharide flippase family protein [Bacteroides rodentium JCM 16496]
MKGNDEQTHFMIDLNSNNKRIAKNTLLLYFRMLVQMVVGLYTSRVVLSTLGVENFGIYNVVGGVVTIFAFLNNSMSLSVQRYLSFDMGSKNEKRLKKIFNIAIYTHLVIAFIVLILGETIGLWFVENHLNLPLERMDAAFWVYQFSVFTCLISIVQVPYNAVIISNERMGIYAYVSIIEVILRLVIVYLLYIGDYDKLILYAILTFVVSVLVASFYVFYCRKKFSEACISCVWDGVLFKELLSFAGWSSLGEIAWTCVQQGVNIVLNIFFGPIVNTARAIALQVNTAITRFVSNFQVAVNPQIIKQYAADDNAGMTNLLFRSTCISYYMMLFLSLPILFETRQVLLLWLGEVPDYTVSFCRLMIINSLIDMLSNLLTTAVKAYGKIRKYQLIVSFLLMLNLPASYMCFSLGATPEASLYVYGVISVVLLLVRLYLLNQMIGLSLNSFFRKVLVDVFMVTVLALIVPCIYYMLSSENLFRLVIITLLSLSSVGTAVYLVGLKEGERLYFRNFIARKINLHGK